MEINIEKIDTELTPDLEFILGMPNYRCGSLAVRLRKKGFKCAFKAEAEQALVIHVMLKFYNEYKENWRTEFNEYI